jgi:hypothetical protein
MQHSGRQAAGERPSLTQIADVFTRYANFTLGGGSATTAVIHGEKEGEARKVVKCERNRISNDRGLWRTPRNTQFSPQNGRYSSPINFDDADWRFRFGYEHAHGKHEDAIEQISTVE